MQLFVISNGTFTKYYANTTRKKHLDERRSSLNGKKTSHSFEFTSWWTDGQNKRIADLIDFSKTFLSKHTLLSVLTRFCVFTSDKMLLVMRPYQIAAAEHILNKIVLSTNHKQLGSVEAGGYIWHTTGSGKTLTSFKTAQLASRLDKISKVLFVVDRKDLDHQTIREYEKFQKGSANSNINTAKLTEQLGDSTSKIIITTIQKLTKFVMMHHKHPVFDQHVVFIFDECHRSQFGEMHRKITKAFKKYHLFGFTGTPIFPENAASGGQTHLKTTEQAFGQKLHTYTIVDAIHDENVLPFKIDYINTLKMKPSVTDKKVQGIDREAAANDPERINQITDYILKHFDNKTKRNEYYRLQEKRLQGFNSLFAVSSIETAKKYYSAFKARKTDLKIALIYSFQANEEEGGDDVLSDEDLDLKNLDASSRDFLEQAMGDYNRTFGTHWDTSADKFENYYKDISEKMKSRDIDLLIVVSMFLTGFDATTLNTLWVDKNLQYHGLLQAFSRTNRILNSVKTYGNIVCFRDLEEATNEAIAMFGNKEARGIVLLRTYSDYYNGWDQEGEYQSGYRDIVSELQRRFPLPVDIQSEQSEKDFIKTWGAILRLRNILTSFDEFAGQEILCERDFQDYQSVYLDLYDKLRKYHPDVQENINDDLVFEIELIKQVTINMDYILQLVSKYHTSNMHHHEIMTKIEKIMNSSWDLRDKKDLIERFVNALNADTHIEKDWRSFTNESKKQDLDKIIAEENLRADKTLRFMENCFRNGELKSTGVAFSDILPPASLFQEDNYLTKKRERVLEKLRMFFDKYWGLSSFSDTP
ncbi:type I restriction enzyme EcoR124II R protein [Caedimonas varicaedens]|uniref:Type I restriction enzyme endonuclease subunit n=1 Tax=Caedimonas varicaedens TaxID=1629334 RepID=A0A0K8MDZ1_9PROT|nr:type I restriction enzyme EcoR124II R protein [Caedimonas varicaedens]